tara:strand:+ start:568 stop:1281 length:714 start_codon:yes stop_codon:yes gene_type:complete
MLHRTIFLFITLITLVLQVEAAPVLFKNKAAFDFAVAGLNNVQVETIDFESQAFGAIIPNGSSMQGVTINENLPDAFELAVNGIGSTSGSNSLGVSADNGTTVLQFGLGDTVTFTFDIEASHAFGLYIVVEGNFDFFADDVSLTFAGSTLSNVVADPAVVQFVGFDALWLGIVDDTATHTTAIVQFGPVSTGEIDDITFTRSLPPPPTVSEPSMIFLIGAGLLGFLGFRRRGRQLLP